MNIIRFDHIGIRVSDAKRAVDFYRSLGFEVILEIDIEPVIIIKNAGGVEINLIVNGIVPIEAKNILMDVPEKYPGITHVGLRVASIVNVIDDLQRLNIPITQGPIRFVGNEVSVFIRDPDRNVIELRSEEGDLSAIPGLT